VRSQRISATALEELVLQLARYETRSMPKIRSEAEVDEERRRGDRAARPSRFRDDPEPACRAPRCEKFEDADALRALVPSVGPLERSYDGRARRADMVLDHRHS